ncbi:MAG TPA: hypothetical protein VKH81_19620 [Candidatus Angelobacter sp.]|nr:hypothetical protein [Candidatus Angelobacter sp.]
MIIDKRAGLAGSAVGSLLLALLVIRGITPTPAAPGQNRTRPATRTAGAAASTSSSNALGKQWPDEGPWKASRQHFAGIQPEKDCPSLTSEPADKSAVSPQSTAEKEISNTRGRIWCIPDDVKVSAMIAIAPDPVHSHLSLIFDRTIEALQLSAETMNYEMDRYWLPWQPEVAAGSALSTSAEAKGKESEPGLLLFRWNGPASASNSKALYIFLVADTSTAGINGSQFRNAVQYVQQVCGEDAKPAQGCGKDNRIYIMGPSFSGSLASLRNLSDAATKSVPGKPAFTAYSGTVSSRCAAENQNLPDSSFPADKVPSACAQQDTSGPPAPRPAPPPTSSPSPTPTPNLIFSSLVGDSESMINQFIDQLRDKGNIQCKGGVEIAILSEAATTYGGAAAAPKVEDADKKCTYTSFRYPREISSLRNASASSSAQPAAAPAQPGVVETPDYLPFTLADQQPNSGDEAPDFSRAQGPLSKEAVLMKYAAELRREHYKYVGIIGTNVVDVLYIAKFLRSACPDVRLFVLNSDLLFERDLDNAPYIGTLSLSTYPLLGHDPEWKDSAGQLSRLPFSDQYEQGQYNASLLAMANVLQAGTTPPLRDVSEAFLGTDAKDPQTRVLPIWLTAVGTGGYWPVQLIPPAPDAKVPPAAMDSDDFSPAWRLISVLLAAFALLQSWILWTVRPVGTRLHDFALINEAPAQRFFFINLASASLACTLAMFMAPALRFGMSADHTVPAIVVVMILAILALAACSVSLWRLLERMRPKDQPEEVRYYRQGIWFSVIAWAGAAAGAILWGWLYADDSSRYGFFFGYRSVNLASGVSPLTPILLLMCAVYVWSLFEILRLRFDDGIRPRLNLTDFFPGATTETDIARSINEYLLFPNYRVVFFLVLAAWLFFLEPVHPFELFEKPMFGAIFEVLFCVVVALMLSSGLRLAQTWTQLNNLLRQLERSPVRGSFCRLKGASWSPIWGSGGQQAEWTNLGRSFEALQTIQTCLNKKDEDLTNEITAAFKKRDDILKQIRSKPLADLTGLRTLKREYARFKKFINSVFSKTGKGTPSKSANGDISEFQNLEKLFGELQGSLATVLTRIMKMLQTRWTTECYEPDDSVEGSKEDQTIVVNCCKEEPNKDAQDSARLEEYVALRYVAFIRGVLASIRLWLILQAIVFSLVLSSLNVYSFEPHRSLVWSFTALFVLIGAVALQVLMQVHRDPVISRITGTKPNKLDIHFFIRIATLGVVPLFTLLATHFPSIGHYLLSFFQPGLEALK